MNCSKIRFSCLAAIFLCLAFPILTRAASVTLLRTPNGGIQPQAVVDGQGTLHLLYFAGNPDHGNLFYVRKKLGEDAPFSVPLRVNSHARSAIAIGTIRGGQLALGENNRVYVVWNGSDQSVKGPGGSPMLFARLNEAGTAFEPERDLISSAGTGGIDGGGSVAADQQGHVYVTWHTTAPGREDAQDGVVLRRSSDDGQTWTTEKPINPEPTGACGCCSMRAFVDRKGTLYILYRSANKNVSRDTTLLTSQDQGATFHSATLQKWAINACPMSAFTLAENSAGVLGAWETREQVYFGPLQPNGAAWMRPAPGTGSRKYPVVVPNANGETLLAWAEGMGWERGGALAWQVYDKDGRPTAVKGRAEGVPVWSLPTAVARPDGSFLILY